LGRCLDEINLRGLLSFRIGPELRLDPKLEDGLNKNGQVVAEDLAQNLIDLGSLGLGADGRAELGFDH